MNENNEQLIPWSKLDNFNDQEIIELCYKYFGQRVNKLFPNALASNATELFNVGERLWEIEDRKVNFQTTDVNESLNDKISFEREFGPITAPTELKNLVIKALNKEAHAILKAVPENLYDKELERRTKLIIEFCPQMIGKYMDGVLPENFYTNLPASGKELVESNKRVLERIKYFVCIIKILKEKNLDLNTIKMKYRSVLDVCKIVEKEYGIVLFEENKVLSSDDNEKVAENTESFSLSAEQILEQIAENNRLIFELAAKNQELQELYNQLNNNSRGR